MMKKLLIAVGAVIAIVVVLVVIAGVIVYKKVDRDFITAQMSGALHRQVTMDAIDINIFSVLSGIEIKKVAISNFKKPEELESLRGKPVAPNDIFTSMEAFRFKVKLLPLLKNQVELKELVVYGPVINLSKNKKGVMNIDDLIKSRKTDRDRQDEQVSDKKAQQAREPDKPLTADDVPVAVAVGEIGVKDGTINYHDGEFDQKFQVYKLSALAHDINIDPKDLDKKDEVKLKLAMGIKTVGAMKTGSVQSFDITIDAAGRMIPFDVKTRLLEPDVRLHISLPDGEVTGLQIFNAIAAIPVLGDYLGQHLAFLKEKQQWKGSNYNGLDLRYKAAQAEITNGRLDLKDARLRFDGAMNIDTKALDMNLGVVMKGEINEGVQMALAQKIESAIKNPEVKKYVDSKNLAAIAMKPLLNKDGQIALEAKIGGTAKKPEVKLTEPQLGSLAGFVQNNAGSLAIEAGKGAIKQYLKGDQQKVFDDVEGLFKRK